MTVREIKFRGKTKSDGLWEFGSLWIDKGKYYINGTDNNWWEVIPETVAQFIGLHDKNGKEIYMTQLSMILLIIKAIQVVLTDDE